MCSVCFCLGSIPQCWGILTVITDALSGNNLYSLDFGELTTAGTNTLDWQNTGSPSFQVSGYNPVMALAQNHVFFFDVPGASAGNAYIFVIHCV